MRILGFVAAAAAGGAGFVGAGLAAGSPQSCAPGTICATTGSGSTTTQSTTAMGKTATGTTSTATTAAVKPPTLTLSAEVIDFGTALKITGVAPLASSGQPVQILSQSCGFTQPLVIAQAKAQAGGKFSFVMQPTRNATFAARYVGLTSPFKKLVVRPAVALRRLSGGLFGVDVSVGNGTFFTKRAILQRYNRAHRRWRTVASGKLRANSQPASLVAVSSAKIRAAVPAGAQIRASVGRATVGKCYEPAMSAAITG